MQQTYLVKYLFKYVHKGPDCGKAKLGVVGPPQKDQQQQSASIPGSSELTAPAAPKGLDEIAEYIKSRYLSYCESVWRLYGFEIHSKHPPVERLIIHLPAMNFVTIHEEQSLEEARDNPDSEKTMLTE